MKSFTATDLVLAERESPDSLNREALVKDFDRLLAANGPALGRLAGELYEHVEAIATTCCRRSRSPWWQALGRFRGECSERTFLFRIAHNRGIAFLARRRAHMPEFSDEMEVHDPGPDPETEMVQEQAAQRLAWAIHKLPVGYRQAITLMLEGLGYGEIGEVLGISESNVGARLTRARQMLRDLLEKKR